MILIDRIPTFRGGLLILSVCFLAACSVDRSAIEAAYIDLTPQYICPCEAVTVDWSCPRIEDTFYCDSIDVTSTNLSADPVVGPREKSGRRELPMVCVSTGLIMDIEFEGLSETLGTTVTVINEGTPLMPDYDLQPICTGAVLACELLPLNDLITSCVEITSFCNNYEFPINVTPEGGASVPVPTGCTSDFNGPPKNLTVAPMTILFIPGGGACRPERALDLLDPIPITVTIECNRGLEDCDL